MHAMYMCIVCACDIYVYSVNMYSYESVTCVCGVGSLCVFVLSVCTVFVLSVYGIFVWYVCM